MKITIDLSPLELFTTIKNFLLFDDSALELPPSKSASVSASGDPGERAEVPLASSEQSPKYESLEAWALGSSAYKAAEVVAQARGVATGKELALLANKRLAESQRLALVAAYESGLSAYESDPLTDNSRS